MTLAERARLIDEAHMEACLRFGREFGLRAFPGRRFTVDRGDSYMSDGLIQLYVHEVGPDGVTRPFAKGTLRELTAQVISLA